MRRLHVLLVVSAALAAALALGVPRSGADSYPLDDFVTLQSQHFVVHYDGNYTKPDFYPQEKAGDILGDAERAYALYTSWGYAPPVDDGDGHIDIWIQDVAGLGEPFANYHGYDVPLNPGGPTSAGVIHLDVVNGTNFHAVAHELFNLFEWRIFTAPQRSWLEEASAEWAAFRAEGGVTPTADDLGRPDRTLDCLGSECGYDDPAGGGPDAFYDRNANPGWSFLEYLSEKYGTDVVRTIWNQAATDGSSVASTTPVKEVVAAKGSSLASAFSSWIAARLSGDFDLLALQGSRPQVFSSAATGLENGAIPTQIVAVNHLAARYITLLPGDGSTSALCYSATLTVHVAIPAGASSAPYLFVDTLGSVAQPLAVSGGTASVTVPWNTCTGGAPAYLSLPNGTDDSTVNGNEFVVTGTLTVDPTRPASPTPSPDPIKINGAVVDAPTSAVPPDIDVFGPELLHVSAGTTALRLIVSADTDGKLQASLGSYALGTATVRAGGNDVRFPLPNGALARLRTTAATSNVLHLTSLASSGALGETVTRHVAFDKAKAKPKKHAEPKPKHKAKTKKKAHH
ncbi:MAG TPA: hypothetical protein VH416_03585 [Gaiellaceae bacterium]